MAKKAATKKPAIKRLVAKKAVAKKAAKPSRKVSGGGFRVLRATNTLLRPSGSARNETGICLVDAFPGGEPFATRGLAEAALGDPTMPLPSDGGATRLRAEADYVILELHKVENAS